MRTWYRKMNSCPVSAPVVISYLVSTTLTNVPPVSFSDTTLLKSAKYVVSLLNASLFTFPLVSTKPPKTLVKYVLFSI
ncbi:hypothetical protein BC01_155 [Bacillus phage BC01]|nr:hypothetical protein BC01_155 [Bacillus phage BC01]